MSDATSSFPKRCFVQTYTAGEEPPPDFALVATELRKRGVEVVALTTGEITASTPAPVWSTLTRRDLVVGDFVWTRAALRALKVPMPPAPDYPECLRALLHRRVWRSTLGGVQMALRSQPAAAQQRHDQEPLVFVKPAEDAKAFSAIIEPRDSMIDFFTAELGTDVPVWCAEVLPMRDEYRVYVIDGAIRSVCRYMTKQPPQAQEDASGGEAPSPSSLDLGIVKDAVATLAAQQPELCAGCALDFATVVDDASKAATATKTMTALIEVNDGYSLGRYPGLSGAAYTDLLVRRWQSIVVASDG